MGIGIWSMHFIIGISLSTEYMVYDLSVVLISMVVAIVASLLRSSSSAIEEGGLQLLGGGLLWTWDCFYALHRHGCDAS